MDDWDDIVREAGEDQGTAYASDDADDFKHTVETLEPEEQQAEPSDSSKTEAVDQDVPPVDDEQCRICFSGAEEEAELGVCYGLKLLKALNADFRCHRSD